MATPTSSPSSNGFLANPNGFELRDSVCRGHHTLLLGGELDMSNADQLETVIRRLCVDGITGLVVDLTQLTFMDSTGLRAILCSYGLCQEHGCPFLVRPGHSAARRLLEVSGTLDVLPLEETESE